MPRFFLYSKLNRVQYFFTSHRLWDRLHLNTLIVRVLLLVAIAVVGISYLGLINTTATRGFEVDNLSRSATTLKEENKKLQLDVSQSSSLVHIQSRTEGMNLVLSAQTEYINPDSGLALDK